MVARSRAQPCMGFSTTSESSKQPCSFLQLPADNFPRSRDRALNLWYSAGIADVSARSIRLSAKKVRVRHRHPLAVHICSVCSLRLRTLRGALGRDNDLHEFLGGNFFHDLIAFFHGLAPLRLIHGGCILKRGISLLDSEAVGQRRRQGAGIDRPPESSR